MDVVKLLSDAFFEWVDTLWLVGEADDTLAPSDWLTDSTATVVSQDLNLATDPRLEGAVADSTGLASADQPILYEPTQANIQLEASQPEDPSVTTECEATAVLLALDLALPPNQPTSLSRLDTATATLADYQMAVSSLDRLRSLYGYIPVRQPRRTGHTHGRYRTSAAWRRDCPWLGRSRW